MPFALIVATLRLILHHLDFLIQSGENNGALDLRALDEWRADGRVRAVVDEEHLAKDNCVTLLQIPGELLNNNRVAFGDDILLPTGLDYGHFHSPANIAFFAQIDKLSALVVVFLRTTTVLYSARKGWAGVKSIAHPSNNVRIHRHRRRWLARLPNP